MVACEPNLDFSPGEPPSVDYRLDDSAWDDDQSDISHQSSDPSPPEPHIEHADHFDDDTLVNDMVAPHSPTRGPRKCEWKITLISVLTALAVHVGIATACIILVLWYRPPSFQFNRGVGEAIGELVQSTGAPADSARPAIPQDASALPQQSTNLRSATAAAEAVDGADEVPAAFATADEPTTEQPADPALFGISASARFDNKVPRRTVAKPQPAEATTATASIPASDSPKTNSASASAAQSNPATPPSPAIAAASKGHVWTGIQPAGSGGNRGAVDGLDSRGLPMPDYPLECRGRGQQGLVRLDVEVRADGSVGHIKVLNDAGYPRLAEAAMQAVRRGHFTPATYDGQPVDANVVVPYQFVLR